MSNLKQILLHVWPLWLVTGALGCTADTTSDPVNDPPDGGWTGPHYPETTLLTTPPAVSNQRMASFAFSSDKAGAKFECTVDSYASYRQPCTSPVTVTVDRDGVHSFEVSAVNDYWVDQSPAKFTWTLDTEPPEQTKIQGPASVDNSPQPVIWFQAEAGATTVCTLDARAPAPCTSPYHAPALSDGLHHFTVVATDAAGNLESLPPTVSWVLDSTTSDTVIDGGPSGVVTSRHQVFAFSSPDATPGSTFRCTLDGAPLGPCSSPLAVDVFTDGNHAFGVQIVEATGNVDPTPAIRSWTVDSQAPSIVITSAPPASTSDTTPTFAFVSDGSAVAIECRVGATAFAPCTSPVTTAVLPEGTTSFEVRVRDAVGNTASALRNVTIDTTPPVLTITAAPADPSNDATPTYEFTVPDATTKCQINGGFPFACSSPVTFSPGAGSSTFRFIATDAAGNVSTVERTLTIDVLAPTLTINDGPPFNTADPSPRFVFTASADATVTCALDDAVFAACSSPVTVGPLALGNHRFTVRARDAAGNVALDWRDFFDDPRPLTVAFVSGPTGEINQRSPRFTWNATGATAVTCHYDAAAFGNCTTAMATALADGPHTFEVRVSNDLGGVMSATRSFTVDTVAPLATITAGPSGTITTPSVTFELTTSGAPTVTECRLQPGGAGNGPYAPCGSPVSFELTAAGSYTFEVRVRDQAGNQWSAYREFTFAP